MLVTGNLATVTQRMHYAAIYLQLSDYRRKMAAATSKSSSDRKLGIIHYTSLYLLGFPKPAFTKLQWIRWLSSSGRWRRVALIRTLWWCGRWGPSPGRTGCGSGIDVLCRAPCWPGPIHVWCNRFFPEAGISWCVCRPCSRRPTLCGVGTKEIGGWCYGLYIWGGRVGNKVAWPVWSAASRVA
jgi:hypothetical protein